MRTGPPENEGGFMIYFRSEGAQDPCADKAARGGYIRIGNEYHPVDSRARPPASKVELGWGGGLRGTKKWGQGSGNREGEECRQGG